MKGIIPRKWLDGDERELDLVGEGYLQGLVPSEMSDAMPTTATERRVMMLGERDPRLDHGRRPDRIFFQVPWTSVHGYWQGSMPLPPERWRDGPEGDVVVLVLDPEAAGGQDVVLRSNLPAWIEACQRIGISEIFD
ncbi:MAG TPA: hypothetical protein VNT56_09385 [Acidimicrobiales bacterium]|nr:hypothetical protein [Acidimicrobiales bacterium]